MNIEKLDSDLRELAEKRTALNGLGYDHADYDHMEEELHHLEDEFQGNYGEFLEEVLLDIHDEYCPDNEVLISIAYLATNYIINESGVDVDKNQGVLVDIDDYPGQKTKLVLIPSPTRILLQVDGKTREEVWKPDSEYK